jgi:RNA polymerase sigma factor (TIGR02999 family)
MPPAVDEMFSLAYEELRRLASAVRRDEANVTMNPTALVHEAWLKLAASSVHADSQLHFKRIAARAMRQVLVDLARRRNAEKRGAGVVAITLDEARDEAASSAEEVLALDEALEELGKVAPRQAAVVESRFFGGFDTLETALLLDISEATVTRDWRSARAWLAHRLRPSATREDASAR